MPLCGAVAFPTDVVAANPVEEFYRESKAQFDSLARADRLAYAEFWASIRREFVEFLGRPWAEFGLTKPRPHPRPRPVPPLPEPLPIPIDNVVVIDSVVPRPVPQPQPRPVVPVIEWERTPEPTTEFTYFGTRAAVRAASVGERIDWTSANPLGDFAMRLMDHDFDNAMADCLRERQKRNLCDWAYKGMLERLAETLCEAGRDSDESQLLYGLLMSMSGYKVRFVRICNGAVKVAIATDGYCDNVSRVSTSDGVFYLDSVYAADKLSVCDFKMPGEKPLRLTIDTEQLFDEDLSESHSIPVKFVDGCNDTITVCCNKSMIEFMSTYPKVLPSDSGRGGAWATCANIPLGRSFKESLYPQLRRLIEGKDELDAARVLLHVAQSFPYGYDNDIWGYDYPLSVEQTWHYIRSDCEDHAIHFSRLVRDLLGLDTVLAYLPNHLVAGVIFKEHDVPGQKLRVGEKVYVVAEATGGGYDFGRTYVEYDESNSYVILLE